MDNNEKPTMQELERSLKHWQVERARHEAKLAERRMETLDTVDKNHEEWQWYALSGLIVQIVTALGIIGLIIIIILK
jgi:hypothetical protein